MSSALSNTLILIIPVILFIVIVSELRTPYQERGSANDNVASNDLMQVSNEGFNVTPDDEQNYDKYINFAIIGFPKCSTTFLRNRLLHTHQFFYGNDWMELHHLRNNNVHELVKLFSNISDPQIKMKGFKCPDVLYSNNALFNLQRYFPSADLIVVVRHPVLWFQSFYNYRVRKGYDMPKPTDLEGSCSTEDEGILNKLHSTNETTYPAHKVCTDRANFHIALSRLGKTTMESMYEIDLLENHSLPIHRSNNRIFFMELGQLSIENKTSAHQLVYDLESFLGLDANAGDTHLPKLKNHRPKHGIALNLAESKLEERLLDICLPEYGHLRTVLVKIGHKASRWIVSYFLQSPQVYVSDRNHLISLLKLWEKDPCYNIHTRV
mmetsp:Transcript_12687/g.23778  ORF Transcript_12687/g.23778 Transcript_12687/m.23778 type:complete len:380 (+) Transcript_12687:679-1818(+)